EVLGASQLHARLEITTPRSSGSREACRSYLVKREAYLVRTADLFRTRYASRDTRYELQRYEMRTSALALAVPAARQSARRPRTSPRPRRWWRGSHRRVARGVGRAPEDRTPSPAHANGARRGRSG